MEEAQEITMDAMASFKSGKYIPIGSKQDHVAVHKHMVNLLVSSNRYGYVFYATQHEGLAIVSASYIDRESRHLSKSSEDDDDDDPQNQTIGSTAILRRPYIPGAPTGKAASLIPHWIALNADETILAIVLLQVETSSWLIILYDVVKLIQSENSSPLCPQMRFTKEEAGDSISQFTWNPAIPTRAAFIDGHKVVTSLEFNPSARTLVVLGKSDANPQNSSICWSSKGKQIVVALQNGGLRQYDESMKLKTEYPSPFAGLNLPPCISVQWLATYQFLLGFSETNADENSYCHVLLTYDKSQNSKQKIFRDLFYDVQPNSTPSNAQFYYARLNESKILMTGLSKSLKINVFGSNELNQDTLDTWTFADHCRASVKGLANVSKEPLIISGMAIGLNSTLTIAEGNKKLAPCPILLMSNSEGVLQVYYFIHKSLPSVCRQPEVIPAIQPVSQPSAPAANGFAFANPNPAPVNPPFSFPTKENSSSPPVSFPQPTQAIPPFSFQSKENSSSPSVAFPQPSQTAPAALAFSFSGSTGNRPSSNNTALPVSTTISHKPVSAPSIAPTTVERKPSPTVDAAKLLQLVNQFQTRLNAVLKPLPQASDQFNDAQKSIDQLSKDLNAMTIRIDRSIESIKKMTSEHIESMTRIETARHQIKLSQKENLHHILKDRELDPWTQERLDSIKSKLDRMKHSFNVLLQLTRTTIHDKSLTKNGASSDDSDNGDFLPELEISLNTEETLQHRLRQRLKELSHQFTDTDKEFNEICAKLKSSSLNNHIRTSQITDTTFVKKPTTPSSKQASRSSDESILAFLRTHHSKPVEIKVPAAAAIRLSSISEPKKQSTIESSSSSNATASLASTPSVVPAPESVQNMMRFVRTSIDLFSGTASPEQLRELSNMAATSPLSSTARSSITSLSKAPAAPKPNPLQKASTVIPTPAMSTKSSTPNFAPTQGFQTPSRSVSSSIPIISLTPATPSAQMNAPDASMRVQTARSNIPAPADLSQSASVASASDDVIRGLLINPSSSPAAPSVLPIVVTTPQASLPSSSAAAVPVIPVVSSTPSGFLASTITTSVQSTSPTTKPLVSTDLSAFGSKPVLGMVTGPFSSINPSSTGGFGSSPAITGSAPLFGGNVSSASSVPTSFGGVFSSPSTSNASSFAPATTSSTGPFGSGFGSSPIVATSSAASTGPFASPVASNASPFGGGFGAMGISAPASTGVFGGAPATTTAAPTGIFGGTSVSSTAPPTGLFGGGAAATTSAPSTSIFGGGFGTATTASSGFGASPNLAASTPGTSPFGSVFNTASAAPSGSVFGGFGNAAATAATGASVFGASTGAFSFKSTVPATSTATPSTGAHLFGSAASGGSTFGSSFAGFGAQPAAAASTNGFSFGGFGASATPATGTPSVFGAQPAAAPFGGSSFGAPPAQTATSAFGAPSSPFGSASAPTATSASFTAYRK